MIGDFQWMLEHLTRVHNDPTPLNGLSWVNLHNLHAAAHELVERGPDRAAETELTRWAVIHSHDEEVAPI